MAIKPVLIAGTWRASKGTGTFRAEEPGAEKPSGEEYPVSEWSDVDAALEAAAGAAAELRADSAATAKLVSFLRKYAERIEKRAGELAATAHRETALPVAPRLKDVELPRTVTQLRQAAAAAEEGSWALPTIDTKLNIRSMLAPIGPVCVIGPNNFPFAYNGIAGGDFAAAIAAGNPVIAKGHPGHPAATRLLAEEAFAAAVEAGLPVATVQLLYHMSPDTGLRMAADRRLGAIGFTGSRPAGMKLKAAADAAGIPIYLEMSSVNPVTILPGALRERPAKIADEYADSALAASGQFCTNPGIVVLLAGAESEAFITAVRERFEARTPGVLLSTGVAQNLEAGVKRLVEAGAKVITGAKAVEVSPNPNARRYANTLLRVDGTVFLDRPEALQAEAFGNAELMVIAKNAAEARDILAGLEGNLTGSIYSATTGEDDAAYAALAQVLRPRVGRMLNDKMPTGVAVTAAMNHGGPYPATGHPGFTAVGFPGSIRRFAALECYDHVRPGRLPAALRDKNPTGQLWRLIDGQWTTTNIGG